jgi:hypothetical protein
MNPIGIRNEDQMGSRDRWFEDRTTAISVLEHGGAVPGGTRVRRSGWPGWRSATGRSCGRRARASSGWPSPSATTGTTPNITHAAPGSTSDPSSAPPPGRAHRAPGEGWPRPTPRRRTGWPSGPASTAALGRRRPCRALSRLTLRWSDAHGGVTVPVERPSRWQDPHGGATLSGSASLSAWALSRGVVLLPGRLGWAAGGERARGGGRRRRGRACISCRNRRGRVGCGRPSCRPGVGAGRRRRAARLR